MVIYGIIRNMVKEIIDKIRTNIKNIIGKNNSKNKSEIIQKKIKYNKHGFPSYRPIVEEEKESNKKPFIY